MFSEFLQGMKGEELAKSLQENIIGEGAEFESPFGTQRLLYADYVASGRALNQVEDFIMTSVLPFYANSHTEASQCGERMTKMRREARHEIARICGADESFSTIFCGSGATTGLNKIVSLLGISEAAAAGHPPLILIGPYEHHSNILPWRESGAEVIEIREAPEGGPDLQELEHTLLTSQPDRMRIGAFSTASNVTGIVTDEDAVTRILKHHGALAIWDCAGGGPYLPIDMKAGTNAEKDAVVISPHKFLGGPGASGILIMKKSSVVRKTPSFPGGGTVRFVSPWNHDYSPDLATREEAGTPNVIGDIRAAMCFLVKEALSQEFLDRKHEHFRKLAEEAWTTNPNIEIIGNLGVARRLPIFSFRIKDPASDGFLHQQLVTRLLSDCYGIQARGGCACAGPYAHRLLSIGKAKSQAMRSSILSGAETEKPGWTRLNFSALLTDEKAQRIISAVSELAKTPYPMADQYSCDPATARFKPTHELLSLMKPQPEK